MFTIHQFLSVCSTHTRRLHTFRSLKTLLSALPLPIPTFHRSILSSWCCDCRNIQDGHPRSVHSSPVVNWSYILRSEFNDMGEEGICIQAEAAPQARRLRNEEDVGEGGAELLNGCIGHIDEHSIQKNDNKTFKLKDE